MYGYRHLGAMCGYHCLSAACGCRHFSAAFDCCCDVTFICVMTIHTSKIYPISNNKSNQ